MKKFYLLLISIFFIISPLLKGMEGQTLEYQTLYEKYARETGVLDLSNMNLTSKNVEKLKDYLTYFCSRGNIHIKKIILDNNKLTLVPLFLFSLAQSPQIYVKNNPIKKSNSTAKKRSNISDIAQKHAEFAQIIGTLFGKQTKEEKENNNFMIMPKGLPILIHPELGMEQQELIIDDKTTLIILKKQRRNWREFIAKNVHLVTFIGSASIAIAPFALEILRYFICG